MNRKEMLKKVYEFCIDESLNIFEPSIDEFINNYCDIILQSLTEYSNITEGTEEYHIIHTRVKEQVIDIMRFMMSLGIDTATMLLEGIAPFDMV